MAAAHDLWFHVQGGPGAHVILKRNSPLTEVGEKSMLEAAGLAALASFRKNDLKAEVMCARASELRRIKGMDPGKARVDRIIGCFAVSLDPDLEKNLEIKSRP